MLLASQILDESNLSGNFTNEYIFFAGKRIAMRNVSTGTIYYYEEDMLGSSRTIVQSGATSPCYDADFLPFGYEKQVTNTCSQSYKFEGKERDTETSNDDFGARYYSNRFGRWLSADWSAVPAPVPYANLTNPQTLNLYAMVSDDPETFADLDGHLQAIEAINGSTATIDLSTMVVSTPLLLTENELAENAPPTNLDAQPTSPPSSPDEVTAQQQQNQAQQQHRSFFGRIFGRIGGWLGAAATPFIRWGRLGGPAHRAAINRVEARLQEEGYTVSREVKIDTPEGAKSSRWVDVVGEKNGERVFYQVGRQNLNGTPVAREVQAMNDIERATGIRPNFVPI